MAVAGVVGAVALAGLVAVVATGAHEKVITRYRARRAPAPAPAPVHHRAPARRAPSEGETLASTEEEITMWSRIGRSTPKPRTRSRGPHREPFARNSAFGPNGKACDLQHREPADPRRWSWETIKSGKAGGGPHSRSLPR